MVGAPGPLAPAPPGGHRRCFHVDGGRARTFSSGTSWGPPSTFSRWWWALPDLQLRHLQGSRRRCFHVADGSSWTFSSCTSRGPTIDVFTLMVGRPDVQLCHLPGACRRRFYVDGGRSQTFSSITFRGPAIDIFTLIVGVLGPSALAPPRGPPSMFLRCWWVLPDLRLWHLPGAFRRRFHIDGGCSRTFGSVTS
jgi:hypothetical protein